MAVYYVTIAVLTGLGYIFTDAERKKRAVFYYLAAAFLLLSFLASFRYASGFDYFAYRDIYEMTAGMSFADIMRNFWYEPLFFVLCRIFTAIGCPYTVFLLFISCFLIFAAVRFIYRFSSIPWLSVYLFITLQFLAYDMNLLRQAIAVSFFLTAYPYLKEKKPVPYAACMTAGGLFHNSLFFMIPLYYFLTKKITRKAAGMLLVLTGTAYFLFDRLFVILQPVIPEKYAVYELTYFWNSSTFDYAVLPAVYALLIYLFRGRFQDPLQRTIYVNSAFGHFLISIFITRHFILERFAVYPFVFALISIPEIVSSYREKAQEGGGGGKARLVLLLFLGFGAVYFLFAARKGFHNVYPYVSLLDKAAVQGGM